MKTITCDSCNTTVDANAWVGVTVAPTMLAFGQASSYDFCSGCWSRVKDVL